MYERIDHKKDIPKELLTYEGLRSRGGTGVNQSAREKIGRKHSQYRLGVRTRAGDIRLDIWIELMQELIDTNNDRERFVLFREYEETHRKIIPDQRYTDTLTLHALECFPWLMDSLSWNHYVHFNQLYRPEKLGCVKFVRFKALTCGCIAWATDEVIMDPYTWWIVCSECGTDTRFEILD